MRKENGKGECGKPICEHKRSTSVVTRFFQNRRKQILLLNQKKNIYILSLYTLFLLTGKICYFFYPAVSVAAKEGALYGRWGGQKWRQLYFQQRTQNTTTDLTGQPDVDIESIFGIAIMTSVYPYLHARYLLNTFMINSTSSARKKQQDIARTVLTADQ